MKILITGGGGFIGRNLARLLPQYGFNVIAPTHKELDMTHCQSYLNFLGQYNPDAIIHTAFKGHFNGDTQYQDFVDNLQMFDNILYGDQYYLNTPTIIIGSGAEFDRRYPIHLEDENNMSYKWPVDLYGLSKNIISRRAEKLQMPFIVRLFGCFGVDEPDFRFIKRSITRLKKGLPIEIEKDKKMDFFYIEDVAGVISYILTTNKDDLHDSKDMNLVYETENWSRLKLSEIGAIICNIMKIPTNVTIINKGMDNPYTGSGRLLESHNIDFIGLHDGIKRMVEELV